MHAPDIECEAPLKYTRSEFVESARVQGKPRIVQQTYLGTADRLADLLKQRTAPVPLSATTREGVVKLGERLTDSGHEDRPIPLPRTPIPAGNHQLCRVDLSSFLYELP